MNYNDIVSKAEKNLFIIGEIGVNHNGSIELAKELIDAAIESKCDAVKFQTWITDKVYSKNKSIKPDYHQINMNTIDSEYELIKKLELSYESFQELKEYCDKRGILFFSTPDEIESAEFLNKINVKLFKTASQDVTNTPFLKEISKLRKPIIFSTGACSLTELVIGVEAISSMNNEIIILHCVSSYPAPVDEMNLNFIPVLKNMFGYPIGLSDHCLGYAVACAAVAKGALFFEKHFTLDKKMNGPDHKASLEPHEFKEYVSILRDIKLSLGDGIKKLMPCEKNTRFAFERFVVSTQNLKKGETLQPQHIQFKKITNGLNLFFYEHILGAKLKIDIVEDTPITLSMLDF